MTTEKRLGEVGREGQEMEKDESGGVEGGTERDAKKGSREGGKERGWRREAAEWRLVNGGERVEKKGQEMEKYEREFGGRGSGERCKGRMGRGKGGEGRPGNRKG
ncbi:hypothetical protein Pcinc_019724 [Petrolisthes cinctipes]|uniref:Uncharacterized protein n=1 Tax=Petrolisthes cinctipes TaxID=88211 RepID=A0AAE1FKN4_PETCI|nr:hypothetical protein Pcinc_019724 [Petrolisthes cinctipes]